MEHSSKHSLSRLFDGKEQSRKLYNIVEKFILNLGENIEIGVTKTQVSFGTKRKFAWVWLPQLWTKNRPETSITLTFDLDHQVENRRIVESVEPHPGKWTHHVVIERADDFDDQVREWLHEAWQQSRK